MSSTVVTPNLRASCSCETRRVWVCASIRPGRSVAPVPSTTGKFRQRSGIWRPTTRTTPASTTTFVSGRTCSPSNTRACLTTKLEPAGWARTEPDASTARAQAATSSTRWLHQVITRTRAPRQLSTSQSVRRALWTNQLRKSSRTASQTSLALRRASSGAASPPTSEASLNRRSLSRRRRTSTFRTFRDPLRSDGIGARDDRATDERWRMSARCWPTSGYIQSSTRNPGTFPNSRMLCVMSRTSRLTAWAAISRSIEPIDWPFFSSAARSRP